MSNLILNLYVVVNKENKFFRAIGYGGSGPNWVDDINRAKFYTKFGQAKSRVTFFYNSSPHFGCPSILEFKIDISHARLLDMEEITKKSINKIKAAKIKREERYLQNKIDRLEAEKQRIAQNRDKFFRG